jgi:hypothetical protein
MARAEGGCLGQVRYSVGADPIHVTICHCRFCQRATGGAYMIEPFLEETELTITAGEPRIYEHVLGAAIASSSTSAPTAGPSST